jgi:hypothetical protein
MPGTVKAMRDSSGRRSTCARLLTVAMVGALLVLVPATSARALTIEVTVTADAVAPGQEGVPHAAPAPGTLRAAMNDANAAGSGPVVIVLPAGEYDLTRCEGDEDLNVSADLDHLGSLDVSIVGQGAGATIRSTCLDRVIDQRGTGVLTLSNVTITGGVVHGYSAWNVATGGGVRAVGAVHLEHAIIDGNALLGAYGSAGQNGGEASGAGVWAGGGLWATDSVFTNNQAMGGEGGTSTCNGSTSGGNGTGGAAHVVGDVTLTRTVVADNQVSSDNGAACNWRYGYGPGTGAASGGGIYSTGTVTVDQSEVSRNQAFPGGIWVEYPAGAGAIVGAGIASLASVHVTDSTFDANAVSADHGDARGSAVWSAAAMDVERSTFTANRIQANNDAYSAVGEGATLASATSVSATNSTFSDDVVHSFPQSYAVTISSPTIDLVHVTVDGDTSSHWQDEAAGPLFSADTMTVRASALHPDAASATTGCAPTGVSTSGGDNWATEASCGLSDPTDVVVAAGDPLLGPLADNGGPTTAHLPQPSSPLIDAIPTDRCAIGEDQRGAPRPAGSGCDVGSVEAGSVVPPTTTTTTTTTTTVPTTTTTTTTVPTTTTTTTVPTTTTSSSTTTTSTSTTSTSTSTSTTAPTTTTTTSPPPTGSKFHPLTPVRIVDSRTASGWSGQLVAGAPRAVKVTGANDVPGTADAVVLNVTVSGASANSFLTVYPSGTGIPGTSNLNFAKGQTTPNLVTVKLGADGKVAFANAVGSVDVVADLVGFYDPSAPGGDRYNPVSPVRALDSRTGAGWSGKLAQGAPRALQVTGTHGVPATADAVVLNVTVTGGSANSFLTAYPTGVMVPNASNLNFAVGETIPNLVTVKLGTGGTVSFANAVGQVDVVADVVGYFDATAGDLFHVLDPTRALDSRTGAGWLGALVKGAPRSLPVAGVNGIPSGAHAVLANTTATAGTANSFVTVYPAGAPLPTASNLNFAAGQTIANLVAVKLGDGGKATFANADGSVHIIADLVGYYA